MSLCIQVKARYIYLAGAAFTIVARFGMTHTKNELFILISYFNCYKLFQYFSVFIRVRFRWNGCNNGGNGIPSNLGARYFFPL